VARDGHGDGGRPVIGAVLAAVLVAAVAYLAATQPLAPIPAY
jgi:hypothetical protein